MSKTEESTKKKTEEKIIKMQKKALKDYGQYLIDQLEFASKKEIRKQYKKYILNQIEKEEKKLAKRAKKKKKK